MLKIFYNRRSTRKFSERKVEEEKIKKLLTAALLAPSSKGSRPWEFIIVDDPSLLAILATSKPHGASLLKHAPLAIVIAGDKTKSDVCVEDCSLQIGDRNANMHDVHRFFKGDESLLSPVTLDSGLLELRIHFFQISSGFFEP